MTPRETNTLIFHRNHGHDNTGHECRVIVEVSKLPGGALIELEMNGETYGEGLSLKQACDKLAALGPNDEFFERICRTMHCAAV